MGWAGPGSKPAGPRAQLTGCSEKAALWSPPSAAGDTHTRHSPTPAAHTHLHTRDTQPLWLTTATWNSAKLWRNERVPSPPRGHIGLPACSFSACSYKRATGTRAVRLLTCTHTSASVRTAAWCCPHQPLRWGPPRSAHRSYGSPAPCSLSLRHRSGGPESLVFSHWAPRP